MAKPFTADERERRFMEYMLTLNKGQLGEVRLRRLNRIANFRKALMELINRMIEERAEDLAAAMLQEYAPERPKPPRRDETEVMKDRLPIQQRRRKTPRWVRESGRAAASVTAQKP